MTLLLQQNLGTAWGGTVSTPRSITGYFASRSNAPALTASRSNAPSLIASKSNVKTLIAGDS